MISSLEPIPRFLKDFQLNNLNHLIEREPSHHIYNLKPRDKNLELKVIILDEIERISTKQKNTIYKYLVADQTGSMYANFYDVEGEL